MPMMLTEVLRQNKEFQLCYHKGYSIGSHHVVIYARKNRLPVTRLGITTGKKVGNAVCRSRARRLIRQAWRENEINAPIGLDVVIVAKGSLLECKSTELSEYLRNKAIPALHKIYAGEMEPFQRNGQKNSRGKKK